MSISEIEQLKQMVAEEQKQKYEAYIKINLLQKQITKLEEELKNATQGVLNRTETS